MAELASQSLGAHHLPVRSAQSLGPKPWGPIPGAQSLGPKPGAAASGTPSAEQGQLGSRSLGDWRPQGRIDLPAKRIPAPEERFEGPQAGGIGGG